MKFKVNFSLTGDKQANTTISFHSFVLLLVLMLLVKSLFVANQMINSIVPYMNCFEIERKTRIEWTKSEKETNELKWCTPLKKGYPIEHWTHVTTCFVVFHPIFPFIIIIMNHHYPQYLISGHTELSYIIDPHCT